MTINATAAILLALYVAVARRRGIAEGALSGTLQNDILKEYVARGTWIYPPAPSMRLVTDVFAYCAERVPKFNTISISGYHIREAGATAPQELAFTFANAMEYVRAAQRAGLDADRFGERLSFFFACHSDFLEEVAKFRCARRLWARLMKERFGVTNPKAQQCRFHVQTGGRHPHRAAAGQQRGAGGPAGAGRGARGLPEPAHERPRRGAGAADRGLGADSPCAPSRSSPSSRGWPTPSTRSAAATRSRRPPTRSRREALRLIDADRGAGRGPRRHRAGGRAARDPGVGLPLPAPGRVGRPRDRGREPLRGGGGGAARRHPAHRPRGGAGPGREGAGPARAAGPGAVEGLPRRPRGEGPLGGEPGAGDGRRGAGPRHRGRDREPAARASSASTGRRWSCEGPRRAGA